MRILGCDCHTRQQTIAMLDRATGEISTPTLKHEGDTVRAFYRTLPAPAPTWFRNGTATFSSANEPARECEPRLSVPDGDPRRKRQREEQSTPQRDGIHAPPRPIVVRDNSHDEENRDAEKRRRASCIKYAYAAERRRKQRDRGEGHEPLVRVGPPPVVEAQPRHPCAE